MPLLYLPPRKWQHNSNFFWPFFILELWSYFTSCFFFDIFHWKFSLSKSFLCVKLMQKSSLIYFISLFFLDVHKFQKILTCSASVWSCFYQSSSLLHVWIFAISMRKGKQSVETEHNSSSCPLRQTHVNKILFQAVICHLM